MRFPDHRLEGFLEFAQRRRVGAHAAFFVDHVPFGIEFAEDRVQKALALHPAPEFQFVGRHRDEIRGHVLRGEGVHAGTARSGINPVKFVFHENVALFGNELLKFLVQFLEARRAILRLNTDCRFPPAARRRAVWPVPPHGAAQLFLLGDDLKILGVVPGANRRRAFEHHVLEQMRNAGDARMFVGAAHVRHPTTGNRGIVRALDQQHAHAVGQGLLDHRHLLGDQ